MMGKTGRRERQIFGNAMQMKGKWYHVYTIALHYSTIAHTLAKFLTMCAFIVTYNILY